MAKTPKAPPTNPEGKTFDFTAMESQILAGIRENTNAIFASVLSMIAGGRMGYKVTPMTQMKLDPNFTKVTLTELEPDVPVAEPGAGVKEAGGDAKAV